MQLVMHIGAECYLHAFNHIRTYKCKLNGKYLDFRACLSLDQNGLIIRATLACHPWQVYQAPDLQLGWVIVWY